MAAKDVIAGVGARFGEAFNLDSSGLPLPATASAVPMQGTIIQGLKTFGYNDPEPQNIVHYGDDRPFAQDSLPSTDIGDMVITTAKTNLVLDAMSENNKVVTVNGIEMRAVNSDKRGSEPQLFVSVYRQALDVQKDSSTFGKLRQYHMAVVPSVRISPAAQGFEQAATDKSYRGAPTPVTQTPWAQSFDDSTWGNTQAEYVEAILDYKPRWNFYRGNGTLTGFQLSKAPFDSTHLTVWVNGTQTAPTTVNTAVANPAFTMGSAPGNGQLVAALIQHNSAD